MELPFVDAEALHRALSYPDAVAALEQAFLTRESVDSPPRMHLTRGGADLLLMPAWGPDDLGVKLVTVNPDNPPARPLIHALYVLFDGDTTEPRALIDGDALTALRTAAVSALATESLASPDASTLVVFGAGTQAHSHIEAIRAVRPIERTIVVSRTRASAERLGAELSAEVGQPRDVDKADIVCTCTTSPSPVFEGSLLKEKVHINAVGSYKPDARELDSAVFHDAHVVVESRDAALTEAGDVVLAVSEGALDPAAILELGEVLRLNGRLGPRTVFKSVGAAFEDLAVARAAMKGLPPG